MCTKALVKFFRFSQNCGDCVHQKSIRKGVINVKYKDYGTGIPQHEIEALARCLLPDIEEFYSSKEGQKEFAEWKQQQAEKKNENKPTE